MLITIIHILLSIILFFLVNLIGLHAPSSFGYFPIKGLFYNDNAPAFNFSLRVLTPVIYLIIVSSLFYYSNLNNLNHNIFFVAIYYVVFRALINIMIGRKSLINWTSYFIYSAFIILLSYVVYNNIILYERSLLPDFSNISNELWLIVIIFIYTLINSVTIKTNDKRKYDYIEDRYLFFYKNYQSLIRKHFFRQRLIYIVYAIMIFEDYNRPKFFRFFENLRFRISGKPHSLGAMQVMTETFLTDEQSVLMGISKIKRDYFMVYNMSVLEHDSLSEYEKNQIYERKLIECYNDSFDYYKEIILITNYLEKAKSTSKSKFLFS